MRLGKVFRIVLIAVPLILIALAGGAILVLRGTDFDQYKPLIEEEAKQATGRDLVIAGHLDLNISFSPAVAVEGVTFSNAEWGSRAEMVRIERFEAQLSLVPLIFGTIDVKRIVLIGADILLEVDAQGHANFEFAGAQPASPDTRTGGELDIPVIHEMVVRDSRLTYSDARTGQTQQAVIDELTVQGEGPSDPVTLIFRGSYNDVPIAADARLGAPAEALHPREPWPVDLTLEAGGATVTAKGTIEEPTKGRGLALDLSAKGTQLSDLQALAGTELPKLGAWSVSGRVNGDPAKRIAVSMLELQVAGSDLGGEVAFTLDGARPLVDAKLRSKLLDLAALGAGSGGEPQAGKKPGKVFPGDPLPLEGLRSVDGQVEFRADTVIAGGAPMTDVAMQVSLAGGDLKVSPITGVVAGGGLDGSVRLDGRKQLASLVTRVAVSKLDVGKLMQEMGSGGDIDGKANIKVDVSGAGGSVAQIMANLDGEASLVMGKGRMKTGSLQTLIGGPTQVLSNMFKGVDSDYTVINCAVVRFPVKKGVATAEPLLLDTDVAAFVGEGTVNLGNETLDLLIKPDVKKTTISAAVPVRIKGTLASPEYALDKKGVARKVGGLLGVMMFPPAAVLGLGELGAGDDNPCVQQAKSGGKAEKKSGSGGASGVLKDAGEGITKGLKGLFGN